MGVAYGDIEYDDDHEELNVVVVMDDKLMLATRINPDFGTDTGVLTPF